MPVSQSLVDHGERNVASSKRPPRCVLRQRGATLLFDPPSRVWRHGAIIRNNGLRSLTTLQTYSR
eukprot:scaffold16424_cov61-Phaeocystis_antarctica.AAC.10